MRRLLRTVAVSSIACGATIHIISARYGTPAAGRIEMGQFACLEGTCYGVGFILFLVNLANDTQNPPISAKRRLLEFFLWGVGVIEALEAVIWTMPP